MFPMIAAVLLMALPDGSPPELPADAVHLTAEIPRTHAAPDTLLDNRLAAVLQMLADEAGFPESPILFTESAGVLDRWGSVLQRDSTFAVMARASARLGHRAEARVLDASAECDVVIVPGTEGGPSRQACRDPERIMARALILAVTRHDAQQTTILVKRWSVALTPVFIPLRAYIYTIDVERRGAEIETRVRSIERGSLRFPDGRH